MREETAMDAGIGRALPSPARPISAPAVWRAVVLTIIGLCGIACLVALIATPYIAGGIFGWNLGPDDKTLISITQGGPADRAGLRVGDQIEWNTLPIMGRTNLGLVQSVRPGTPLRVTVIRENKPHTVTLVAVPWGNAVQNAVRAMQAAVLLLIAIGILLVYRRPCRMTWGFLLALQGISGGFAGYLYYWGEDALAKFIVVFGTEAIASGLSVAGMLMFMSRFPADRPRGALRIVDRAAVPLGVIVAALALTTNLLTAMSPSPPPAWLLLTSEYVFQALFVMVSLATLVLAYVLAAGSERQRIIPVLASFALFVAVNVGVLFVNELYTTVESQSAALVAQTISLLLLAAAVAHGVIRHRVIGISFAVSRTVVYTMLTSLVVGAFILIDFVSAKLLDHLQLTIALEVLTAMAFGISLNALHSRIDRFVDSVLFRRRHLAEARLQRSAKTLVHAESASFIDQALVTEPCDALNLESAAVFRADASGAFARTCSHGWNDEDATCVGRDDRLVITLLAELQEVDVADVRWVNDNVPHGLGQPLLAVPFVVRHELLGFALYSGHGGGEALDPDEKRSLTQLAGAAAVAYEHVNAKIMLAEAQRLREQNHLLEHDRDLLERDRDLLRSAITALSR